MMAAANCPPWLVWKRAQAATTCRSQACRSFASRQRRDTASRMRPTTRARLHQQPSGNSRRVCQAPARSRAKHWNVSTVNRATKPDSPS